MKYLTFLKVQALEFRRLLEREGNDPILGPQLRERLADAEKELQDALQENGKLFPSDIHELPRAALFLKGGGVPEQGGIRPDLAGEVLIQYEKMFIEQALHDEREAARNAGRQRRRRGAPTPGLLFTGTPGGSFGLVFAPQPTEEESLLEVHVRSLRNIADALVRVAGSDAESLDDAVGPIPPRMLHPLKQFLKTLADYGAELRLAFHDRPPQSLTADQIKTAAERLERDVTEEEVELRGTFRGLTLETGHFDLRTDAGDVITGTVADHLTEDDLQRIDELTNKPCKARLLKTTIQRISRASTSSFVLLDAE